MPLILSGWKPKEPDKGLGGSTSTNRATVYTAGKLRVGVTVLCLDTVSKGQAAQKQNKS